VNPVTSLERQYFLPGERLINELTRSLLHHKEERLNNFLRCKLTMAVAWNRKDAQQGVFLFWATELLYFNSPADGAVHALTPGKLGWNLEVDASAMT
jgi:hypothetical protein